MRRGEPIGLSVISLIEIAVLVSGGKLKAEMGMSELLAAFDANPAIRVLPVTHEIACDLALLGALRDPADRTIVATARVHRLTLVTSDRRIIESGLVAVVD